MPIAVPGLFYQSLPTALRDDIISFHSHSYGLLSDLDLSLLLILVSYAEDLKLGPDAASLNIYIFGLICISPTTADSWDGVQSFHWPRDPGGGTQVRIGTSPQLPPLSGVQPHCHPATQVPASPLHGQASRTKGCGAVTPGYLLVGQATMIQSVGNSAVIIAGKTPSALGY